MATLWLISHGNEEKHKAISVQTQKNVDNTIAIDVPFHDINSQITIAKLQLDAEETAYLIAKLAGHLAQIITNQTPTAPIVDLAAERIKTFGEHWDRYSHNRPLLLKRAGYASTEYVKYMTTDWDQLDSDTQGRLFRARANA